MNAESIDAIVCDPPYGLEFMGKEWDHGVPGVPFWTEALRVLKPGAHLLAFGGTRTFHRLACAIEDAGFEIRDCVMWVYGSGFPKSHNLGGEWSGWGTALKPAWEPIIVARKPLCGTVAQNVQRYGTGALNVDGGRVGSNGTLGRWPANLIHDGSDEVVRGFPFTYGRGNINESTGKSLRGFLRTGTPSGGEYTRFDSGSAARFFYCAKASKADRDEGNTHPTVKPTALIRYLCRLVTPPGGLILDPFAGSGSTGKAALLEGFRFVGIERDAHYCEIARARIEAAGRQEVLA